MGPVRDAQQTIVASANFAATNQDLVEKAFASSAVYQGDVNFLKFRVSVMI